MGALLAMIPAKDLLYSAIIAILIAGFAVFVKHERDIGAQKIELADKAASAREVAVAEANNAALSSKYGAKLKDTEDAYQATLATAVGRADTLAASLSTYAHRRCARSVPAGPAPASKPNDAAPVAGSDVGIAEATRRAIDAAAADAAELKALQAERRSLNAVGK
jgi:hypothetical protein